MRYFRDIEQRLDITCYQTILGLHCHAMKNKNAHHSKPGGVRHDPQRFMGKTVTVPHFNRDTVEFTSRKRNESNPGIKTLLPFPKIITEESDFENF